MSKEPEWLKKIKKIQPLFSTRDDVIKIFGQPLDNEKDEIEYYEHNSGRMSVIYSTGECIRKTENGEEKAYGWNVPEWTVISIYFRLKERIEPKKLNINFTGFRPYEVSDTGAIIYESDELGINYTRGRGVF